MSIFKFNWSSTSCLAHPDGRLLLKTNLSSPCFLTAAAASASPLYLLSDCLKTWNWTLENYWWNQNPAEATFDISDLFRLTSNRQLKCLCHSSSKHTTGRNWRECSASKPHELTADFVNFGDLKRISHYNGSQEATLSHTLYANELLFHAFFSHTRWQCQTVHSEWHYSEMKYLNNSWMYCLKYVAHTWWFLMTLGIPWL